MSTEHDTAAKCAAEITRHLYPDGFIGDEENSATGHAEECDEKIAAIIRCHLTELERDRERLMAILEAWDKRESADNHHLELVERSVAEGWDNDPTGTLHIQSASNKLAVSDIMLRATIEAAKGGWK